MKLTRRKKSLKTSMDIAPLIDVVFLLIIFCLYLTPTTHYARDRIVLPDPQASAETPTPDPEMLVININSGGFASANGVPMNNLDELAQNIKAHHQRYGEQAKVLIRGDRETQWRNIQTVLRTCSENGITRVRHAVQGE